MNVLITGSTGQLGQSLNVVINEYNINDYNFIFVNHDKLDISNIDQIRQVINDNDIDVVINCAAYTNVDKAESDYLRAKLVNAYGPKFLADELQKRNGFLIHISTDYVTCGNHYIPIPEIIDFHHNPSNIYGQSKLLGEEFITSAIDKYIIIRTSWLYSEFGKNFLKTIYNKIIDNTPKLNVVDDQIGTPTYAYDLAKAIIEILKTYSSNTSFNHFGIYNYSNEGVCSWYDFAQMIKRIGCKDSKTIINRCNSKEFPSPVIRPSYSVLDKSKIKETFKNVEIPYWVDSLENCINKLILI